MKSMSEKDQPSVWFDLCPIVHAGLCWCGLLSPVSTQRSACQVEANLVTMANTDFLPHGLKMDWVKNSKDEKEGGGGRKRETERGRNEWFSEEHIKQHRWTDGLDLAQWFWKYERPPVKTKYVSKKIKMFASFTNSLLWPRDTISFLGTHRTVRTSYYITRGAS